MHTDRFRLDGQVAVVTGANRGLGRGIAVGLAEAGARIVSVQRADTAPELAEQLHAADSALQIVVADVTAEDAATRSLDAALAAFGRVDILVNNAGVQRRERAEHFTLDDWDRVMNTNLRAIFCFCQQFGRVMLEQGRGKIVNIASLLAFQGGITVPAYTASKHAIAGLTKALCNEWAGRGINVNAIAPGYMDTEMNSALRIDPLRNRAIGERIPAGRWGTAEDIAGAAVFLAAPASDYIHGQTIVVDGGWLAR
jgi:2-deoxy-D-gluconate 3-dehydrogenase